MPLNATKHNIFIYHNMIYPSVRMPDIEIKNMVKLFTVLLLSEGEQHGYDIMKKVQARIGKKASPGQIYPFLGKTSF